MKIKKSFHRHFALFFFIFCLSTNIHNVFAQEENITTIKITNARQTSYKKADDTGNDTIILEGSVELSVAKGDTISEIKADKITFDRKTEMLFADGNVEIITKTNNSGNDKTTANSLLLNTSTLEGIFDGGRVVQTQSDALNLPSGSTLVVFSDLFGKSDTNVIAFKNSSLTFCDDENPHWKINATRTWLLPGGEFAFFNALLYVGSIPVLYFPAFYYPKDELIYNPVFSYRKREGYSTQNTIYVYGRKPLDSSSDTSTTSSSTETSTSAESLKSLYNFMKPSSLKKQKLEGLILHNLDEDYDGDTTNYFKIMADWYSNLGFMAGLDSHLAPSTTYVTKIDLKTLLGWSHPIFKDSSTGDYLIYSPTTGIIYDDSSNFLGVKMPFRYGFNFDFELVKPFKLSVNLPVYSDPFFAYDFEDRQETMDWISYFLSTQEQDNDDITISEVSSLTWKLSASYSPTLPSIITPYLNSFSINFSSTVNIASTATSEFDEGMEADWKTYTPSRKFYYPSQVTPVSLNASLSGTIFQYPFPQKTSNKTTEVANLLNKPDEFKSPSQLEKEELERKKELESQEDLENQPQENMAEESSENTKEYEYVKPVFPDLDFTESPKTLAAGFVYNLGYSIAPSLVTQLSYSSVPLKKSDDFDWENIRSYIVTYKMPTTLTSNLTYGGSFFGLKNAISYEPVIQKHPYIQVVDDSLVASSGGYSQSSKDTIILSDYNAQAQTISNTNTVSFYPFANTSLFTETGISWNTTLKLLRQKFIGDVENPEWENLYLDWEDDESVTANTLNCVIGLNEMDKKFKQNLTFTTVMPPQLKQYTATLSLVFPYVTNTISVGIQEKSKDDSSWKKNPFQQSLTVSLPIFSKVPAFVDNLNGFWQKPLYKFFEFMNSTVRITESLNYNLEDDDNRHFDSFKLSLSWKSISLSYVGSYTLGYDLDAAQGWQVRTEKEFLPYSFSFSYTPTSKTYYTWSNRIQFAPSLNTSVVADLIRPTNSYLSFTPSITFKINEFFNLTFSSTSKNSILYWYFHEGLYDEWGGFPGNMFKDLFDSFRFDDNSKRKGSGFKLKSLNMTISHELHDWSFNMTCKIEPRLLTEKNVTRYDFSPYITIGIVWNPMQSMKTEIVDEYGKWSLQ